MTAETAHSASEITQRIRALPPLPDVAQEIVQNLNCEFVDGNTVADIVSKDPAISARLIGVANSAFFGLQEPVADMRQVVNQVIGVDPVRSMSIALAAQSLVQSDACSAFDRTRFWHRSLLVGACANRIALDMNDLEKTDRSFAYLSGLCHNLGLLVLANIEPERLQAILEGRDDDSQLNADVQEAFSVTLGDLTLSLAKHWQLPEALLQAYRAAFVERDPEDGLALVLDSAISSAALQDQLAANDSGEEDADEVCKLSARELDLIEETARAVGR